ncbi:uncharacterized protein LOC100900910 [Galendromus occidentalis]|uniref:Uncharacterized protein LOC100900910 n=1 Tax=Galendromus occidentalis TaxID=34638 RepID=A0AAJ7L7V6_9ACAR|nr:uncharacterized protein LOC100900910 [Galendromus occidentalis]
MPPSWRRMLLYLCVACFLEGITYSHLGSFFNVYAIRERHLSATQYGIILGSYSVMVLIITPLTAALVAARAFTDKTILCSGMTLDAVFTLFMAAASEISSKTHFFLFCLLMRVVQAIGRASAVLMLYVIAGAQLEKINHVVIPLLETIYGASVVVGPVVSGFLNLSGFFLPFVSIGGSLLAFTLSAFCFFPDSERAEPKQEADDGQHNSCSIWSIPVLVNALACYHAFYLISFNESTLAVKLNKDYGFKSSESGIVFLFSGISYAVASLVSGYYSKKVRDPRNIVLLGLIVVVVGISLLGQKTLFETRLWIFCLGQVLLGLGSGPMFVCCYLQSLRQIGGSSPSKDIYASLMALFNPASSIGTMLGPFISGIMMDNTNYEILTALNLLLTLIMLLALALTARCSRSVSVTKVITSDSVQKF